MSNALCETRNYKVYLKNTPDAMLFKQNTLIVEGDLVRFWDSILGKSYWIPINNIHLIKDVFDEDIENE
jgi:hypothetical protein